MEIIISTLKNLGMGDLMFAVNMANTLKQFMDEQQIPCHIYLATSAKELENDLLGTLQAELEEGIQLIDTQSLEKLIEDNKVKPTCVIDGPVPALLTKIPSNAQVFIASEYSIKPKPILLGQYKKIQHRQMFLTGLNQEAGELGIFLPKQLLKANENRPSFWEMISPNIKAFLLAGEKKSLFEYTGLTELSFSYCYKNVKHFLKTHQQYIQFSQKSQDVFFVTQNKTELFEQLKSMKDALIADGFSKIIFSSLDDDTTLVLHQGSQKGKTFRLMHAKKIHHSDFFALQVVAGKLTGRTGDQSFGEAVCLQKIICYEALPHKEQLVKAYLAIPNTMQEFSKEAKEALGLLVGCDNSDRDYIRLGVLLRMPNVIHDIQALHGEIIQKYNLEKGIQETIVNSLQARMMPQQKFF